MLSFLKLLFGLLGEVARLFQQRQLLDAGKKMEQLDQVKELERRVEIANRAADPGVDPVRAERLQKRFDRDAGRK